jgi:putative tricarboxylic transport membrane protein
LPYRWLVPVIVLLGGLGVYSLHHSVFDIWLLAGFGLLGYVLNLLELDAGPLLLGFILGPGMEAHLRAALELSGGDWSVFVTHPLSAALLLVTLFLLALVLLPVVQLRREEALNEEHN